MSGEAVQIQLDCAELDPSQLQHLARDLSRALDAAAIGDAHVAESAPTSGQKGDAVTVGAIILTLIQAGGIAVKMLEVLRAFIERKSTLKIKLARPDGLQIAIDASCLGKAQMASTQKLLTEFCRM